MHIICRGISFFINCGEISSVTMTRLRTGTTRRRIKVDAAVKELPPGAPLITGLTADPASPRPQTM